MKLPNKVTSYKESVLSKFPIILEALRSFDQSVFELYQETGHAFLYPEEFIDTLDCLYALGKIEYLEEKEVLHYVV